MTDHAGGAGEQDNHDGIPLLRLAGSWQSRLDLAAPIDQPYPPWWRRLRPSASVLAAISASVQPEPKHLAPFAAGRDASPKQALRGRITSLRVRHPPPGSRPSYGESRCLFPTRHIGDRGALRESIQIDRASLACSPPGVERKLRDDAAAAASHRAS
jgi:hypothetical protein